MMRPLISNNRTIYRGLGTQGLTGRKIVVDTYGGYSRHGGVPSLVKGWKKVVDHFASYAARYIAKNIMAAGLAKAVRCMPSWGSCLCSDRCAGTGTVAVN